MAGGRAQVAGSRIAIDEPFDRFFSRPCLPRVATCRLATATLRRIATLETEICGQRLCGHRRRERSLERAKPTAETGPPRTGSGNAGLFPAVGIHVDSRRLLGGAKWIRTTNLRSTGLTCGPWRLEISQASSGPTAIAPSRAHQGGSLPFLACYGTRARVRLASISAMISSALWTSLRAWDR
jgi:hypothetical protein